VNIQVKILENADGLGIPFYATGGSSGLDLYAAVTENVVIKQTERALISTGLSIAIPEGFEGQIRPRSGLAYKKGITVLNTPGTIDSDYRGEIKILLINLGTDDFVVERGLRIAQLVIQKYEKVTLDVVDSLDVTIRSGNGYGSTGMT
jgi:dUTP pyrophosphatase